MTSAWAVDRVALVPGPTGPSATAINWRGGWEIGETYAVGDGVAAPFELEPVARLWVANAPAGPGVEPGVDPEWTLITIVGPQGVQGSEGVQGDQGDPAESVSPALFEHTTTVGNVMTGQPTDLTEDDVASGLAADHDSVILEYAGKIYGGANRQFILAAVGPGNVAWWAIGFPSLQDLDWLWRIQLTRAPGDLVRGTVELLIAWTADGTVYQRTLVNVETEIAPAPFPVRIRGQVTGNAAAADQLVLLLATGLKVPAL